MAILILLLAGCATSYGQRDQFYWLEGTWKIPDKQTYEIWQIAAGAGKLTGKSFRISERDTIVTETISLEFRNGGFHFIPDVAGDQPPVVFTITHYDDSSFVAENNRHDFPKLIRYALVHKRGHPWLTAQLEGNGKVTAYNFKKIK